MANLSDSALVKKTETTLATTVDSEAVILETSSGMYYGLNEVATFLWEQLDEEQRIADLRDAILSEYEVSPERCQRDLETVINDLEDKGLVEVDSRMQQ